MSKYIEVQDAIDAVWDAVELHKSQYDAIETALQKIPPAKVAPVIYGHRILSKKHKWKRFEDGQIDMCAWAEGYCNGPLCTRCWESFCIHCEERFGGETRVEQLLAEDGCVEHTACSVCGREIPNDAPYCNCGAKMEEI